MISGELPVLTSDSSSYFRSGLYPVPQFPYVLGCETEGTVVKTGGGDLSGLKEGDRVVIWPRSNAYAEYTAAPTISAARLPVGLPPKLGAAAFLQGMTALTLIREAYHVQRGDWVLVHAAAGGTGQWLCRLLREAGATTIGTTSTPEKAERARLAGAAHVIDYGREDVGARVAELTGGRGVAAVFDGVGQATFDVSLGCLARKGTMVSFGNSSGAVPPQPLTKLVPKNLRLLRPTLLNYITTREEVDAYTSELFSFLLRDVPAAEAGVQIHAIYPLSEVAGAHEDLTGRKTTGKLLLDPSK